ncbi:MAG: SGNH/GDSL hydrolase family protein [Nanoarchaeota archaeon]
MPTTRRLLGNILLLLLVCVIFLTITDLAVRWLLPQHRVILTYDDVYVHKYAAGKSHAHINDEGKAIMVSIDDQGFRGPEVSTEKKEGTLRVMVYGDSFIAGEYSQVNETYASVLGTLLSEKLNQDVEVINAGVDGYGPDQSLRRMQDEVPLYKPDIIVSAIFVGNDYGEAVRNKIYRLRDGRLVANTFTIEPDLLRRRALLDRSPLLRMTYYALTNIANSIKTPSDSPSLFPEMNIKLNEEDCETLFSGDNVVHNAHRDRSDVDMVFGQTTVCTRYRLAIMEQILATQRDIAEENRAEYILVIIPERFDVSDDALAAEMPESYRENYSTTYLTSEAEAMAQRQSIMYINLYEAFREGGGASFYWKGDSHWNAAGQRYAAELTAKKIIEDNGKE